MAVLAALAVSATLAGCVTSGPARVTATIPAAPAPQPVAEVYQPMPADVYVSTIADRDVVVFRGDTYLWVTGPDGVRRRQFYAHGDHRADVFRRREQLHAVMARHEGRLPQPEHAMGRPGIPAPNRGLRHAPVAAAASRGMGNAPVARVSGHAANHAANRAPNHAPGNAPASHMQAQARPAPASQHHDTKEKNSSNEGRAPVAVRG
jgi:hypothetical protein